MRTHPRSSRSTRSATRPSPAPARSAATAVRDFVARQGLRRSATRDLVVDTFLATPAHASVEDLLARVRRRDRTVGQATIYRTLKLLERCGVAVARTFSGGVTRYEPMLARPHHDHLICTSCGEIVEFENPEIEALQLEVARRHGFQSESHRMELYGRCPRCRRGARPAAGGRP